MVAILSKGLLVFSMISVRAVPVLSNKNYTTMDVLDTTSHNAWLRRQQTQQDRRDDQDERRMQKEVSNDNEAETPPTTEWLHREGIHPHGGPGRSQPRGKRNTDDVMMDDE